MNMNHTKLRCIHTGEEFIAVEEYVGEDYVYRAISLNGYLSQAVGDTIEELISEINGLEEVEVERVDIKLNDIKVQKPPLGIKPRLYVLEGRLRDIDEAMTRYIEALVVIPEKWIHERNEIIQTIQRIRKDG